MASLTEIQHSSAPEYGSSPRFLQAYREQWSCRNSQQHNSLSDWWAVVGGVQGLPIIYFMGDSGIAEGFHFLFYTAEIPPCCSQRENQPQLCPLEQGVPSTTPVSQFIVSTGMWCHFIYLVLAWIQLYLEDISPNNQNIINQSAIFIYV